MSLDSYRKEELLQLQLELEQTKLRGFDLDMVSTGTSNELGSLARQGQRSHGKSMCL